jgi:predicted RNA binding protein YcfA (HicA-like mRNA interferase family)
MSVKRGKFIKYLEDNGCYFHRHGSKHDIFKNEVTGKKTTLPRHPKLDPYLCDSICKQLDIPQID